MHVFDPSVPRPSRGGQRPIQQTGCDGEDDEQVLLAEELSEREGISMEVAYSIVCRHHVAVNVKEARQL